MFQVLHCKNCSLSDLKSPFVTVTLTKFDNCCQCHKTNEDRQSYNFCSIECFNYYLRFHNIEWKEDNFKSVKNV